MNKRTQELWSTYRDEIDAENERRHKFNKKVYLQTHERTKPVTMSFLGFKWHVRRHWSEVTLARSLERALVKRMAEPSIEDFLDWCRKNNHTL